MVTVMSEKIGHVLNIGQGMEMERAHHVRLALR
jgi:hypothetical protein